MKWEEEDIIESLQNDYVLHYKNHQHYLSNDNQVDADWEGAVCDYIFDKLKEITGGSDTDVADKLDEKIEGIIEFDPNDIPPITVGSKWYAAQDICYCHKDDLYFDIEGDEDWLEIGDDGFVYIDKGTLMVYKGIQPGAGGWPEFEVHGEDFEFAGDPFKIKPAK